MALSSELISQFAKLTNNDKKEDAGAEVKGTFVTVGGVEYVRLDGSEILTPVTTTVEAVADERVVVLIQDHMATVIKNITSPAARNKSVEDIKDEVDEFGNTIQQMDNTIIQQQNSIIQMDNNIYQMNNTINQHGNSINQQGDTIVSLENTIVQQNNQISSMNNTVIEMGNNVQSMNNTVIEMGNTVNSYNNIIQQHGNDITQLGNTITQQGNVISQQNNIIQQQGDQITSVDNRVTLMGNEVNIQGSQIVILNSGFKIQNGVLTGLSKAILDSIETDVLEAGYAAIDFANIEIAAIEKLFTDSGIIKDLVVDEGHITGELVGVTIKGDLIEAGTLVADKLVVKGEDGIYYKLNMSGEKVESEQTEYNSLDGSVITAQSITATKIFVEDLVAFGATIAGFIINDLAIHSELKNTMASDAQGLYMDKEGQFYIGTPNQHVKYSKNQAGEYELSIRANKIFLGTGDKTVGDSIASLELNDEKIIQSVEKVTDNLNSNYYTITETNKVVNDASEGLMNTFSKAGGNNLVSNSGLFFGGPTIYDYWNGSVERMPYDYSVSKTALKLKQGVLFQSIMGLGIGDFSLRFKFKKIGNGIGTTLKFKVNNETFDILQTEGIIELSFYNTSGNTDLAFECNQSDQFIIFDIMMNYGKDVYLPYQQAMNELKSTTVQISESIKIESNVANTITVLGTDGLIGYNKTTGKIVFKQTESGIYTTFMKADEAEISDLMIKKIGNQVWITGK